MSNYSRLYPSATASRRPLPSVIMLLHNFWDCFVFFLETWPCGLSANTEWLAERLTKEMLNCRTGSSLEAPKLRFSFLTPTCGVTRLVFEALMYSLTFQRWRQHSDFTRRPLTKSVSKWIECWMQKEVSLWRNANRLLGIGSQTCFCFNTRSRWGAERERTGKLLWEAVHFNNRWKQK